MWIDLSGDPARCGRSACSPPRPSLRQRDPLLRTWHDPDRLYGWLVTVQNGPVVNRYMFAAFALFVIGGIEALMMRTQLADPGEHVRRSAALQPASSRCTARS